MSHRPILDGIRVASPCSARWDDMKGDDARRDCRACGHEVYNLAALTTAEALDLVARPGAPPCVRFFRRADGTVLTADCPVGRRATRRHRARLLAWVLAPLAALLAACGLRQLIEPGPSRPPIDPYAPIPGHVLGKIAAPFIDPDVSAPTPPSPPVNSPAADPDMI